MPTLVLLRHAKAEALAADDRSRRLVERGRAECAEVRAWLTAQGVLPDRVLVSSAARARETWELAGVGDVEAVVDERLFTAGVQEVREVVAETPAEVRTLVVVGHNPTLEDLVWELDDSEHARDLTSSGMRTAGAGVFELTSWDAADGRLVAWR